MPALPVRLKVDIVTPLGSVLSEEVDEARMPSVLGELGVLPGHRPLLAAMRAGLALLRQGQDQRFLAVGRGFAEVGGDHVILLVDRCALGAQVDVAEADERLRAAEKAIDQMEGSQLDVRFEELAHDRDFARACLDAARAAGRD